LTGDDDDGGFEEAGLGENGLVGVDFLLKKLKRDACLTGDLVGDLVAGILLFYPVLC